MKISAIILSKNQENRIRDLIDNLRFCDEIIVLDDNSIDETVDIAKRQGAKVFERKLDYNFAQQRNFGLKLAKFNWVLYVDCDELITDELKKEIENIDLLNTKYNGFYIKRIDYFLGKRLKYGEVNGIKLIRLAKKESGEWKRSVHEYWSINGKIGELNNPIIHNTNENLKNFLDKINFYSNIHAVENAKEGKKSNLIKIVFYPIGKFILNYIFKLGFLDGSYGFIHAMYMSLHSFFSWSKLWTMQKLEN